MDVFSMLDLDAARVGEPTVWKIDALCAEIERLRGMLAECYRLTGADPDGNEDWRLADDAVREVRRLREAFDRERGPKIAPLRPSRGSTIT